MQQRPIISSPELSGVDAIRLTAAMSGEIGALLRAALENEAATIQIAAAELVMDQTFGQESRHQTFDELTQKSLHIAWTRAWLDGIGRAPAAPGDTV